MLLRQVSRMAFLVVALAWVGPAWLGEPVLAFNGQCHTDYCLTVFWDASGNPVGGGGYSYPADVATGSLSNCVSHWYAMAGTYAYLGCYADTNKKTWSSYCHDIWWVDVFDHVWTWSNSGNASTCCAFGAEQMPGCPR